MLAAMPGPIVTLTYVWSLKERPRNCKPPGPSAGQCVPFAQSPLSHWCQLPRRAWRKRRPFETSSSPPSCGRECCLPRKTDASNPADSVATHVSAVAKLLETVAVRAGDRDPGGGDAAGLPTAG